MLRKMMTIMAFTFAASTAQASTHPSEAELAACKTAMDHHTQVCTADHASKACQDATKNVGHACAYQAHTSAQPSVTPRHEPAATTAPAQQASDACLSQDERKSYEEFLGKVTIEKETQNKELNVINKKIGIFKEGMEDYLEQTKNPRTTRGKFLCNHLTKSLKENEKTIQELMDKRKSYH